MSVFILNSSKKYYLLVANNPGPGYEHGVSRLGDLKGCTEKKGGAGVQTVIVLFLDTRVGLR